MTRLMTGVRQISSAARRTMERGGGSEGRGRWRAESAATGCASPLAASPPRRVRARSLLQHAQTITTIVCLRLHQPRRIPRCRRPARGLRPVATRTPLPDWRPLSAPENRRSQHVPPTTSPVTFVSPELAYFWNRVIFPPSASCRSSGPRCLVLRGARALRTSPRYMPLSASSNCTASARFMHFHLSRLL